MMTLHKEVPWIAAAAAGFALMSQTPVAKASSHMDAPLITLDDAANTTDVYSFVTAPGGVKTLTTALAVYPFEEPGIGPAVWGSDGDQYTAIEIAAGSSTMTMAGQAVYRWATTKLTETLVAAMDAA